MSQSDACHIGLCEHCEGGSCSCVCHEPRAVPIEAPPSTGPQLTGRRDYAEQEQNKASTQQNMAERGHDPSLRNERPVAPSNILCGLATHSEYCPDCARIATGFKTTQREAATSEGATRTSEEATSVPVDHIAYSRLKARGYLNAEAWATILQFGAQRVLDEPWKPEEIISTLRARLAEVEREREEQKDAREFMEGQREIEAQRARNAEARVEELEKALQSYISTIRYQISALENGGGVGHVLVALKSADTTIRAALEDKR